MFTCIIYVWSLIAKHPYTVLSRQNSPQIYNSTTYNAAKLSPVWKCLKSSFRLLFHRCNIIVTQSAVKSLFPLVQNAILRILTNKTWAHFTLSCHLGICLPASFRVAFSIYLRFLNPEIKSNFLPFTSPCVTMGLTITCTGDTRNRGLDLNTDPAARAGSVKNWMDPDRFISQRQARVRTG